MFLKLQTDLMKYFVGQSPNEVANLQSKQLYNKQQP